MKIYEVGGAVRDRLLGLGIQDHDFVVVGATPEQMIAAGFKLVGTDFPVFLHPVTHHEYALARTERKTAPGYKGFVFHTDPSVTLEQDLGRRDLTINAIARDPESGEIIDPFNGRQDLELGQLRHVGDAFGEDPVRILRVARFAARFADRGFHVSKETMTLMRQMVMSGEVDHLVPERVWQELSRGLMERTPSAMLGVLEKCGALSKVAPELESLPGATWAILDANSSCADTLPLRYAVLTHTLSPAALDRLNTRLRAPRDCSDMAILNIRWHGIIAGAAGKSAEDLLDLFAATDALRRPNRFMQLVKCSDCLHTQNAASVSQATFLATAVKAITHLDYQNIVDAGVDIPQRIRQKRLDILKDFLQKEQT